MAVAEDKLKKQISTSKFMEAESFRLYVIAVSLGWEAVALTAAHGTLATPLEKLPLVDELQDISGAQFYRFLEYRFRCQKQPSNPSPSEFVTLPKCTNPSYQTDENTSETISGAPALFDTPANGNIILRSSDSIDFFVIEGLIRFVSPVFDSKFPLQGPSKVDGWPVITVSEDSRVLYGLLDMIYPHVNQTDNTQNCHLFGRMVQAARKYEMSIVEKKLQKLGENLASKEPLRMYAIATSLGMNEVATIAAFNTLSQPLQDMLFVELELITGADLFRLMRYRFSCAKEVFKVLEDSGVHVKHGFTNMVHLVRGSSFFCIPTTVPIVTHELRQRLNNCPRGTAYRAIFVSEFTNITGSDSATCMPISAVDAVLNYRDGVAATIEDAVSKISLEDVLKPSAFEEYVPAVLGSLSVGPLTFGNNRTRKTLKRK